jgi:uncharacterized protein YdhG (YjbR/CyaY superfamily)
MNELDDTFDQYLGKIESDTHQKKMHQILVKTFLHLELSAEPKIYHKIPSFFLNDQLVISYEALKKAIAVYPGNEALKKFTEIEFKVINNAIKIPWDISFPFSLIEKIIKSNEAFILDNSEGIDHAED